MTTRGEINSNFYQIVNVDSNGAPTSVKPQYITGGNVDNATHANVADVANSVSVANVVGIGNIAVLNLDGNSGNILYGNGVFSAVPNTAYSNNSNYANFAGTAFNVSGSNVTGTVANANYSAYAGNANVSNVANSVSVANVSGIGNIAVINLDGNVSNILHGDGSFGPEAGNLNANYANFAGEAFNVSGSNVTGTVANANYSLYAGNANIANTANSVAVANVVGIGNIAVINLDGNGANVLHGNGVFAPEASDGNANYANFAGTLINGTSNVSIPTANANILISTAGNANIIDIWAQGTLNLKPPAQGPLNSIRIDTYGRSGNQGAQRISSFRYRGNSTTPLSVQPSDYTMEFLTIGYNGSGIQTNSVAQIRAQVDSSYTANGANIPLGWQILVNDTNGGVNNQTKTHNFYSNGSVSFANSIYATNGNIIVGSLENTTITNTGITVTSVSNTGRITADFFEGSGGNLSNIQGANVSGTVANATYAISAGTASAVGNIANLSIISSNTALPTEIINTAGIVVGSTANANLQANSFTVITDYGNGQGDGNLALTKATSFVKSRGNSASPTAASQNDIIDRENHYSYNGTSNVLHTSTRTVVANTNANANAIWGGGIYRFDTGNPLGDVGNANAQSAFNTLQYDQWGRLVSTQGTAPTGVTQGLLVFNNYGGAGGPNNNTSGAIVFNRFFGNRDSNLAVGPGAQTGRIIFLGANSNGSATTFNTRVAQIAGVVDSSYVQGSANVPQGLTFTVCDNTTQYTHQFYANSNVLFGGTSTSTVTMNNLQTYYNANVGTLYASNSINTTYDIVSTLGQIRGESVLANSYIISNNSISAGGGVTGSYLNSNSYISASSSITGNTFNANTQITIGNSNVAATLFLLGNKSVNQGFRLFDAPFTASMDNINPTTGFSPFFFNTYDASNAYIPPSRYFRARGTQASPNNASVGDSVQVSSYAIYADSGNTYKDLINTGVYVTENDGAGNTAGAFYIQGFGANSKFDIQTNTTANNITINSNNFMKLSVYTASALTAITGSVGQIATVSNSGGGGNPNGMMAFWDTTNNRWSYVHDNSAV